MPKSKDRDKAPIAVSYKGKRYEVIHCEGALDSFREALGRVLKGKAKSLTQKMAMQIQRLANGEEMSKENFPSEGILPALPGQQRSKKFHALKKIPIRGYCWQSDRVPNTWFISHYIYKDKQGLDNRDIEKVGRNWRRIEEDSDER